MNTLPAALLCLSSLATVALAQDPRPATVPAVPIAAKKPAAQKQDGPVYDEKADARQQVAAALARAEKDNKRVLIQWGANWCGWCKLLAGKMKTDPGLQRELLYEYEVLHVDVGRFDKNMDLASELGAKFHAIPFLTVLDASGKALVQQNTEPFETKVDGKGGHDPQKLLAFLKEHAATPLDANAVLAAALANAKQQDKRVFLHFGAPWCGWCHRLEAWLARPEIAAILGEDFVDTKIDIDRMTDGEKVYEAQLAAAGQKKQGIPWFVFLGADGALLAHSNGPEGNVGFPYQPAEVAYFVTMLNAAKVHMTDEDVETLRASLDQNRTRRDG